VIALILHYKPDLTIRCRIKGQTPLQRAAERLVDASTASEQQQWREIVQLYLGAGAEYDLLTAIYGNDLDRVKAILAESPEFADDYQGRSPLRAAAALGRLEISRYLIANYRVDVNDFERGVGYPIIKEALSHPAIVRLLIENGADLKTRISWRGFRSGIWIIGDDATVLHYAAADGVPETVRLLLDCGVDVLASANGFLGQIAQTALDVAAYFGKADNLTALLDHPQFKKLDREQRQELLTRCLWDGAFHSWSANATDRSSLLDCLLHHGADLNSLRFGRTPLHEAVRLANPVIVRLMVNNGARTDIQDTDGETPLDQLGDARSSPADEIRRVFREYAARGTK
jgi:ankyrin repeat protein